MKKALLFAALAFSMNATAQNIRPTSTIHHQIPNLTENLRGRTEDGAEKTSVIHSEKIFGKTISHQIAELLTTIQLYDSIYQWQWDTLLTGWALKSKFIDIVYNAHNSITNLTGQNWNGSSWVNSLQIKYTYDTNNNQTSLQYNSWNGIAWTSYYQSIYTYDANNNQTNELDQLWNGSAWMNTSQYIYTYDGNNNQIKELDQYWNISAWENTDQYTYTYDANNNQTSETDQSWNVSAWENTYQYFYTYDANNNRTIELDKFWNGSAWVNTDLYTYTFDANKNQLSELGQTWDGSNWMNFSKYTNTYNANNNPTSQLLQYWNGSAWENSNQYIFTYNANHNLTKSLSQIWNGSTWVNTSQSINTYADNFLESNSNRNFNVTGTEVEAGDSIFYYFHTVTGIKDLASDDGNITIYPNPSSGKFTIKSNSTIDAVEIYNVLGERIYSNHKFSRQTSTEIDLSDRGIGIYFIHIYDGTLLYNRRVVIQ